MKAMDAVIRDLNRDLKQWPSFSKCQPARCSMKIQSTIINRAHALLLVGTRFSAPRGAHMPRHLTHALVERPAGQVAGHRTRQGPVTLRVKRRVNWPGSAQFSNQPPANPRLI